MTSSQQGPLDARQGIPPRGKGGASNGCIIGMVGCGALLILMILVGGAAMFSMSRSPRMKKLLTSGTKTVGMTLTAQNCSRSLLDVRDAIAGYQRDHHGAYPPDLDALRPRYLAPGAGACVDDSGKPLQMDYYAPKPTASGNTVMVNVYVGEANLISTQSQAFSVCLEKSGWILMDQSMLQRLYAPDSKQPARPEFGGDSDDASPTK